jgi:hypothetical protein
VNVQADPVLFVTDEFDARHKPKDLLPLVVCGSVGHDNCASRAARSSVGRGGASSDTV